MKVIVIVDAQRDFITGSLANAEADKRVSNIVEKIKNNPDARFVCTQDTHYRNYLKTFEGINLPVEHCIKYEEGWEIDDRITEVLPSNAKFIEKPTFGSFDLGDYIATLDHGDNFVDEIEMCGFVTSICVISNAIMLRAKFPNKPITIDASCCAGLAKEDHDAALTVAKCCQINVVGE
jgi:nicotinamidase-related amidase